MLTDNDMGMSTIAIPLRFIQTASAYLGSLFLGIYLSSAYSQIILKAVFIAIPVLALAIARIRTRSVSEVFQFPIEVTSESTRELAITA